MKIKYSRIYALFLILSFFVLISFTAKSYGISNNIINKIEARYKNIYSIRANFYQKEIMPGYSQNMAFKGLFYYERNKGMTWVYEYPFNKRQILKKDRLYIVNNRIKKVTVVNVGIERGGFPPNIIKVIGSLTKYFIVKNISKNLVSGEIVLKLKPITMQRAKEIYVGFDANNLDIKSLKIITYQGQIINFIYKNVKFNSRISGKIFNINFPSYYKIIKEN
ncbi:MAG: LolA family protein [bacterium]